MNKSLSPSKIQFWFILFLSCVNFIYMYYYDVFPDNILSISSSYDKYSLVSYFFYSLLSVLGYYSGIWVVIFFIFFIISYRQYYLKRNKVSDIFLTFILALSFSQFFFLLKPSLLGEGLFTIYDQYYPKYLMVITTCIFFFWAFLKISGKKVQDIFANLHDHYLRSRRLLLSNHLDFQTVKLSFLGYFSKSASKIAHKYNEKIDRDISQSTTPKINELKNATISEPDYLLGKVKLTNFNDAEQLKIDTESSDGLIQEEVQVFKKKLPLISSIELIEAMEKKKKHVVSSPDALYFKEIVSCLEDKLAEFKILGKVTNIMKGPVVDTFELELGAGVKVSKVTSISEDLSLALAGAPIRIVYPLKGKTTVGIEVPRNPREIIYLDDVLKADEFRDTKCHLPIAMGKDAFGDVFVVDLAAMPHMLVAGSTGAGKSVFINTVLVSLLVKTPPEKMRLILIDPKQLELALYSRLPHLILPVITEPQMAAHSLLWACQEMERRYSILKELGVRNIDGYNRKVHSASKEELLKIKPFFNSTELELPFIVIVVDEFADLILSKSGKDIENNICRLAAKARAAGIHLILATQRPSVDVITGLIKSNFPTRVSFRVTSSIDSRTILNSIGAEKLLGMGDMLYKHGIEMLRVHSSYIDEEDIEGLIDKLCVIEPEYNEDALEFIENGGSDEKQVGMTLLNHQGQDQEDELYPQALDIVLEFKSASASMLQRRLKIGYNRAANLIELMESKGIVGPQQGSKPRKILSNGDDK